MKKGILWGLLVLLMGQCWAQLTPDWVTASADYQRTGSMMAMDGNGDVVVVGYRASFLGAGHIFTRKLDHFGNVLWEQVDTAFAHSKYQKASWVNVDGQNNVLVVGYQYAGTSSEYTDSIVALKYDAAGTRLWRTVIPHVWPSGLPMRSDVDALGNLYIGTVGLSPGFELIKLDPQGNVRFDVANASAQNQSFNSMRLRDHLVVMTSYAGNGSQVSVCAFDTAGTFLWSDMFPSRGGADVEIDSSYHAWVLTMENNQVGPSTNYDIRLVEYDTAGNQLTHYDYDFGNGVDYGTRMTLVNGKISVIGTSIPASAGYMDWITFQTDLNGNKLWEARYNEVNSNDEKPSWISATDSGDVFVSGQGGPDTVSVTGSHYLRFVALRYHQGNVVWVDADPYQGYVGIVNVIDGDCGLFVLGETAMTAVHYADTCLALAAPRPIAMDAPLQLHPNPATQSVTVSMTAPAALDATLLVTDLAGRPCLSMAAPSLSPGENAIRLDVSALPSGVYLLHASGGEHHWAPVRLLKL